jgi:hypothetical protein
MSERSLFGELEQKWKKALETLVLIRVYSCPFVVESNCYAFSLEE